MTKYTITLEQAKRLLELGFGKPVKWWWVVYRDGEPILTDYGSIINDAVVKYPAYHVGELGDILPDTLIKGADCYWLSFSKYENGGWEAYYQDRSDISMGLLCEPLYGPTEAQARGQLLIYLIENKLI